MKLNMYNACSLLNTCHSQSGEGHDDNYSEACLHCMQHHRKNELHITKTASVFWIINPRGNFNSHSELTSPRVLSLSLSGRLQFQPGVTLTDKSGVCNLSRCAQRQCSLAKFKHLTSAHTRLVNIVHFYRNVPWKYKNWTVPHLVIPV